MEGIECNACLTNIFKEINQIDGVAASIDYRKKTVTLDIAKSRDNVRVINKVKAIANKHGHHFIVKEKRLENKTIKTFSWKTLIVRIVPPRLRKRSVHWKKSQMRFATFWPRSWLSKSKTIAN